MTARWCNTSTMKALGLVLSDRKFFENFWPHDLLMQLIRTIWTILVEDYPGTIPVEVGQIPISGSRKEVVWIFRYIIQCKIVPPGRVQFWRQGQNLNNFGRGPLDDAIYQIWSSGPCCFRQDFWKLHFENLFLDPVTYLCNQSKQFEKFL